MVHAKSVARQLHLNLKVLAPAVADNGEEMLRERVLVASRNEFIFLLHGCPLEGLVRF